MNKINYGVKFKYADLIQLAGRKLLKRLKPALATVLNRFFAFWRTAMAYKTSLVAISWHEGEYEVVDQTSDGNISLDKLKKKGIVHDVSDDVGYIDAGAIIRKCDFPKYYVASNDPYYDVTKTWFKKLPKKTEFIFAHFAEYGDNLTLDLMNIK